MSSTGNGTNGAPDLRGRTVVWSAGSRPPGTRRRRFAVLRWVALLGVAAVASFGLAYAVHSYVVVAPPPAGPAAPLWLPDQLPADDTADRALSARPSASRTPKPGDDRDTRPAADDRGRGRVDRGREDRGRDDRGQDSRGRDDRGHDDRSHDGSDDVSDEGGSHHGRSGERSDDR